jgi:hypothetical protein
LEAEAVFMPAAVLPVKCSCSERYNFVYDRGNK